MPYSMFCVGNDGFHCNDPCIYTIGDVYDIRDGMQRLTTGAFEGVAEVVEGEVEDAVLPDTDYLQQSHQAMGQLVGAQLLAYGVDLMQARGRPWRVTVAAHNQCMIWTDSGFASCMLYPGDVDPMRILAAAVHPALASAGLAGIGVLGSIGSALMQFSAHGPTGLDRNHTGAEFMVNFEFRQL